MMTIERMALLLGNARKIRDTDKIEVAHHYAKIIERDVKVWLQDEGREAMKKLNPSQAPGYSGPE